MAKRSSKNRAPSSASSSASSSTSSSNEEIETAPELHEGLNEGLNKAREFSTKILTFFRHELSRSRFTFWHGVALAVMFALVIIGGTTLTVIDHSTLKPSAAFPPLARSIAYFTNIPVKQGFLHFGLYSLELALGDYDAFGLHTGQRVTTLWFQWIQHHRWGQHLHMQVETLLQVLDLLICGAIVVRKRSSTRRGSKNTSEPLESSKRERLRRAYRERPFVMVFLVTVAALMIVQNLITSSAYHTLAEQLIGFVLCCWKIAWDYSEAGSCFNWSVGRPMVSASNLLTSGGFVVVLLGIDAVGIVSASPPLVSVAIVLGASVNSKYALIPSSVDKWVKLRSDDLWEFKELVFSLRD